MVQGFSNFKYPRLILIPNRQAKDEIPSWKAVVSYIFLSSESSSWNQPQNKSSHLFSYNKHNLTTWLNLVNENGGYQEVKLSWKHWYDYIRFRLNIMLKKVITRLCWLGHIFHRQSWELTDISLLISHYLKPCDGLR